MVSEKNHSTELAALEFVDRVVMAMDHGKMPLSIFLDLSKAFDSLDHKILLAKLDHYGVKTTALELCKSYLKSRTQSVKLDDIISDPLNISTGVPQGSILGPFFFLIYVNDFQYCSNKFSMINYADDTTLLSTLNSFTSQTDRASVNQSINIELAKVYEWLCSNKLCLNVNKTEYMVFHQPQKDVNYPILYINNIQIDVVENFNFLGITVNEHLSWTSHVAKVIKKISKTGYVLSKLKNFLPEGILLTIYNSLITPHLNYGILLWGSKSDRIFKLQKKLVRHITHSRYNAHTDPLFKKLGLLKVNDIKKLQELKFFFKFSQNLLPAYFRTNFIIRNYDLHEHATRNRTQLVIPIHQHQYCKANLRFAITQTVNSFPNDILSKCHTHSLQAFASHAKKYFLSNYPENCSILNCYICQQ